MTGWDVFTGRASLPPRTFTELAALRAALPGYDVMVTSHSPSCRYEAIRRASGPGPWCVISSDPADLWRELAPCIRFGARTGMTAARAPGTPPDPDRDSAKTGLP
jgi:hypothetical protein